VAPADRCPHRSFPLSAGRREADTIVCGYHGLRFDARGDCVEVPSQSPCPKSIGTRSFPLVEVGPMLFIWLGDPALADPRKIVAENFMRDGTWVCSKALRHMECSYVRLHENLMDLTHLSYLHLGSFGNPDYARSPYEVELGAERFALTRRIAPTTLPPIWGRTTGIEGEGQGARVTRSEFMSPALHEINATFYDVTLPAESRPEFHTRTYHLITPETHNRTHYFVVHGRDFAREDASAGEFMHTQLMSIFDEDQWGLGLQEQVLEQTSEEDYYEMSIAADGPSIAVRRYIKARSDQEHAAAALASPAHAKPSQPTGMPG
jgi:vanillate O-demethylase monooxygenase subunit